MVNKSVHSNSDSAFANIVHDYKFNLLTYSLKCPLCKNMQTVEFTVRAEESASANSRIVRSLSGQMAAIISDWKVESLARTCMKVRSFFSYISKYDSTNTISYYYVLLLVLFIKIVHKVHKAMHDCPADK